MSLQGTNKIETNKYELTVAVDAASFEQGLEKAYRQKIKSINVPGFRRGKAPRKMVERLYGEGVFFDDAVNGLYPDALAEAVKEAGITPVARPSIEVKEVEKSTGFTFVATYVVKPEVKISDYKGIEAEKTVKTVADEDVDKRIEAMQTRNARLIDVEGRASREGDTLVFDFDGSVDGVPFDGGKAEKFTLEIGSKHFIPGFEEQLVNRGPGDEFDVSVTFPEEYQEKSLQGKAAVFHCRVHELKGKELPALDDEFAKDVSEFDTLAAMKDDIRQKMQEQQDKDSDDDLENKLVDKLIENLEAEIPQEMFETRMDEMVRDFAYRLQSQGMNLETYLQYTGMEPAAFRATFEEQAKRQVKARLAMEEIVRLEGIVPTGEELEAEYQKAAEAYKLDVEQVKNALPQEEFVQDIAVNKAIELVKNSAKVTQTAAGEEKKPAQAADGEEKKPVKKADGEEKKPVKKADGEEKKPAKKADGEEKKPVKKAAGKQTPKADAPAE